MLLDLLREQRAFQQLMSSKEFLTIKKLSQVGTRVGVRKWQEPKILDLLLREDSRSKMARRVFYKVSTINLDLHGTQW